MYDIIGLNGEITAKQTPCYIGCKLYTARISVFLISYSGFLISFRALQHRIDISDDKTNI